jgi:hypothetical protein
LGPDHPKTRNGSNFPSGGEFFDLLETIFGILEVKDDPRTAAEFVRDNWQAIDKTPGSTVGVVSVATAKRRGNRHQKAPIDRL